MLLQAIAVVVLLAGVGLLVLQYAAMSALPVPAAGVVIVSATLMLVLVRTQRQHWAVGVMCWGVLAACLISAFLNPGLLSLSLAAVPIVVMAGGLFLGQTAAYALAFTGLAAVLLAFEMPLQGMPVLPPDKDWAQFPVHFAAILVATLMSTSAAAALKQHLRKLRESQSHLSSIMDSTNDLIFSVDPVYFSLLVFNTQVHAQILQRCGVAAERGMLPEDIFKSDQKIQKWKSLFKRTLNENAFSIDYETSDGAIFYSLKFQCIQNGDEILGISVFGRDITQEKNNLKALAQQHEFQKKLVDSIPGIFYLFDVTGRFIQWNSNFEHVFGKNSEQIRKSHPLDYISEKDQSRTALSIQRAFEQGECRIDIDVVTSDGRYVPYLLSGYRFEWQGQVSLLGIGQDISERKSIENELLNYREHLEEIVHIRTEELTLAKVAAESSMAARSSFLANMSHEIRTPLNAIIGLAHLIHSEPLMPKQLDRLGKLEASASHLLEIINAILDMTKIDSGKMLLEDEPICLHQIVNAVTAMLSERMQDKGLQLRTEIFPLNFNLRGDATRLRQALLNYATNAIKFTPAGSITVRTLLLKDTPVDALIRFEVRDTGVGIDTAVISRLFSNFEQADKTISRNYGGTGLGLAITKKISELMGGDAGVESEEGKGSTFWFTAKLRKDQAVKLDSEVHTPVSFSESNLKNILSGARILLAEDESINQEIAVFMLEEVHMVVDTAENGEQAVQFASDKDYDLILMDMNMPVMDGLLATQKIRQSRRNAEIPILAMTANAFVEDRNQCIAAGMNDFISKPVELDVLYAKLEKWLSR